MAGPPSNPSLRLASARRRVRAFVEQISDLESADFPHSDGKDALALIKAEALSFEAGLARIPPSAMAVDHACTQALILVSRHTEILGFILRSTNVRNAFEVHFPLKRLVNAAIGDEAKLVMSSEWAFVPFTYPMTLDILPNYVLVGGPAQESGNALLTPLAGHEIGHSAWRKHRVREGLITQVVTAVNDSTLTCAGARSFLLGVFQGDDSAKIDRIRQLALDSAFKQLEEIFCDIFGVYVFGSAYLYSYEYFLAPGVGSRTPTYPSSRKRVEYVTRAAKTLAVDFEADIFDRWQDAGHPDPIMTAILIIADEAVESIFPNLLANAEKLLGDLGIAKPSSEAVERVASSLELQVPDGEGATLPEIVIAGWERLRSRGGMGQSSELSEFRSLNELILKSIEVSEFRLRVA